MVYGKFVNINWQMNVTMYRLGLLLILNYPSSSIGSCLVSNLYSPEGMSVTINMQYKSTAPQDISVVEWWNNEIIMRYYPGNNKVVVQPIYKRKVKFDNITFSLELMNLQKKDSGVYRGQIVETERGTICAAEYKLFVVESVAAPVLTVANWSSSDSCNLTVTCRGHDLSLTFSCNSSDCTQLGDLPITPTLTVLTRDGKIVCNHSNQVSWHNDTLDMLPFCDTAKGEDSTSWIPLIVGLVSVIVAVCVCVSMIYLHQKRKQQSTGAGINCYALVRAQQ